MKDGKRTSTRTQTEEELLSVADQIERHLRSIRSIRRRTQMKSVEADIARMSLTPVQMQVLEILVKAGNSSNGISLKDLSRQMGLAHSTTSGIVDRVARQGLVHRVTNPDDRRQICIQVDAEVRDFMQNTWPSISLAPFVRALEIASDADRAKVVEGLAILDRLLMETCAADQPATQF